ncbi:MAG: glutamate:proton symporter [Bacteroidetes bacterium RIFCSPHIGHO2_02_FULL_44_7]|nr:MAG: glutamate:proton symporter [Bacteroidetes bacterium RIFCSPHIGHO2_02_FULL_44_7]
MGKLALHWKILIAMALGIIWAILSGMYGMNKFTADWIDPFGKIFINCLKFIAVPLVLFSIVTGVAGLGDPSRLGRMGYKTLGLYLFTTVFAVSVGLVIANFSGVGLQNDEDTRLTNRLKYEIWATDNQVEIMDDRFEMATANPLKVEQVRAKLNAEAENADPALMLKTAEAKSNLSQGPLQPLIDLVPDNLVKALGDGRLMLQVIFFALLFGIAMVLLPTEKTSTVRSFFDNMNDIFIKMVHMIMRAAPFFVFCLMAGVLAKSADSIPELLSIFADLGAYALAVVIGLALMLFLFYPMLLRLFGVRIGYRDFFRGLSPALFLAFSTSSSAATLPVTIECANDNLKIPEQATDFVLPIGATVNMDGTSLYQALAVIFLAHYYDVDLSLMQQLGIVVTATLASIGAAAVPGAGLIMLMIVLDSTGLNPMWVALIMPMDRILDMCRTVVNVCSDVTVSAIIAKSEKMEI